MSGIAYRELDTIFLDAGNTVVSMDFHRIIAELRKLGVEVGLETLRRAEAAARPAVSRELVRMPSTEGPAAFQLYVRTILANLPKGTVAVSPDVLVSGISSLRATSLKRLWNLAMPGAADALGVLKGLGLRLVVVSNSDGTLNELLNDAGLLHFFDHIVDSTRVGFEKPDPRIFEHALRLCNGAAARTLHVGDVYHLDIVGARRAGLHALLLDPYNDWPPRDCEKCADLASLARIFKAAQPGRVPAG